MPTPLLWPSRVAMKKMKTPTRGKPEHLPAESCTPERRGLGIDIEPATQEMLWKAPQHSRPMKVLCCPLRCVGGKKQHMLLETPTKQKQRGGTLSNCNLFQHFVFPPFLPSRKRREISRKTHTKKNRMRTRASSIVARTAIEYIRRQLFSAEGYL